MAALALACTACGTSEPGVVAEPSPGPGVATAADTEADGLPAVRALLTGYEAAAPTAAQLESVSADPAATVLLLSTDPSEAPAVRQAATRALGTVPSTEGDTLLLNLMDDPTTDKGLRRAAVQAAAARVDSDSTLRGAVESCLRDPEPAVARAAVLALAPLEASRATLEVLADEDVPPQVRTALDTLDGGGTAAQVPIAVPETPTRQLRPGQR